MFKSIIYLGLDYRKQSIYHLEDTDFDHNIDSIFGGARGAVVGAFLEYQKRNLPVAKNIASIYLYFRKQGNKVDKWPEWDCTEIETHYPELQYGTKYYPCILNQYKMLRFGDRS